MSERPRRKGGGGSEQHARAPSAQQAPSSPRAKKEGASGPKEGGSSGPQSGARSSLRLSLCLSASLSLSLSLSPHTHIHSHTLSRVAAHSRAPSAQHAKKESEQLRVAQALHPKPQTLNPKP